MENTNTGGLPVANEPAQNADNSVPSSQSIITPTAPAVTVVEPVKVETPIVDPKPQADAVDNKPKNILHVEDAPALTTELKGK